LPKITTECFTITGCGFNRITTVHFGATQIYQNGAFGAGSWRIVSDTELEVCPPLCLEPCRYCIAFGDAHGTLGSVRVEITAVTEPTLVCEDTHQAGTPQSIFINTGRLGRKSIVVFFSAFNTPSEIPGLIRLDIGANFTNLLCGPPVVGECVERNLRPIATLSGHTIYFQAVVFDPIAPTFPLPVTNVCATTYTPAP
jgi:hypothetical protein